MATNILGLMDYVQQQGDKGRQQGQQQSFNRLAGQAYSAAPAQQNALISQAVSVDPQAGLQLGNQLGTLDANRRATAQAAEVDHNKKLRGAAQFALDALKSKDPARIQGAGNAVGPYLTQLTGKQFPGLSEDMLPALYQVLAQTGGEPDVKGVVVGSNGSVINPATGELMYHNAPPMQYQNVPMGEGKAAGAFDPSTGTVRPAVAGAAQGQTQGQPQPQGDLMQPFIAQANQAVQLGADPAKVETWLQQQAQQIGAQPQAPGQDQGMPAPGGNQLQTTQPVAPSQFGIGTPKPSGAGNLPSGYRMAADGRSLEPIPGGPADPDANDFDLSKPALTNAAWGVIMDGKMPSLGRSKSALKMRATIMNQVADIAKEAGVSPADLATQHGRVKALQASLQNLQKQSDVMEKNEETFKNNANVLLNLSDQVSRSGIPAFNQFLIHVKTNYQGDPQAAAFLSARNLVAQEYAKIAAGATGAAGSSDTAQTHALSLINTAQTPDQLRAVIDTLGKDIDGQKHATEEQLLNISSRMQQFGATSQYPGREYQMPPNQSQALAQGGQPRAVNASGHAVVWNGSAWVSE